MTWGVAARSDAVVVRNRWMALSLVIAATALALVPALWWAALVQHDSARAFTDTPAHRVHLALVGLAALVGAVLALRSRTIVDGNGIDDRWFLSRRRWSWHEVVVLHAGAIGAASPLMGLSVLSSTRPPHVLRSTRGNSKSRRTALLEALDAIAIPPNRLVTDHFLDELPRRVRKSEDVARVAAAWWGPLPAGAMPPVARPALRTMIIVVSVVVGLLMLATRFAIASQSRRDTRPEVPTPSLVLPNSIELAEQLLPDPCFGAWLTPPSWDPEWPVESAAIEVVHEDGSTQDVIVVTLEPGATARPLADTYPMLRLRSADGYSESASPVFMADSDRVKVTLRGAGQTVTGFCWSP